jgi:hypothetical protein
MKDAHPHSTGRVLVRFHLLRYPITQKNNRASGVSGMAVRPISGAGVSCRNAGVLLWRLGQNYALLHCNNIEREFRVVFRGMDGRPLTPVEHI